MGLLDKYRLERKKYISIEDFINLIAFMKNEMVTDIISYFVINDLEKHVTSYNIDIHDRIFDSRHIEKYGFDLNTRLFLEDSSFTLFFEHYITYLNSNKIKKDFYYLKDELNSIEFIKELNLDFNLQAQANKAVSKWNSEQKEDKIYRASEKSDFNKPNYHQLDFFKQDEFSIIDAACLLAGVDCSSVISYQNHPEFTQVYDDYISYKLMIELAIDNGELYCIDETIAKIVLQKYLFNIGYIIKGFNDWLTIEPAKSLVDNKPSEQLEASYNELKEAQAKISDLETQLEDKNTNASFMMGSPTLEQGAPRDSEQIINDLKKQIQQLTADQDQAQTTIAELKEQLNIANTTLTNTKSVSIAQSFDWQNMSEHIYPPELHLALMVWQRIYWDNELKDSHITSHNGKFEAIAKKVNLNPKSTLGKRVKMVINTAHTKKKQSELAEQLQAIEHINISAN